MAWREITRKKREQVASLIPLKWRLGDPDFLDRTSYPNVIDIVPQLLSKLENEITNLPVAQLLESLHRGRLTAREVLDAFCHRTALAHQLESLTFICQCHAYPALSASGR